MKKKSRHIATIFDNVAKITSKTVIALALTLLSLPVMGQISGTLSVCQGSTTGLTDALTGGAWTSGNTAVATISSSGVVTGVTGGTATISYTSGATTHTAIVTVNAFAGSIVGLNHVCIGNNLTLTSTGASGGTWSASNSIATVSSGGVVTGMGKGWNTISYTVTNGCGTGSATMTMNVDGYTGNIYLLAGDGTNTTSANGSVAYTGGIQGPRDMVTDTAGTLYICDVTANVVRTITRDGIIRTIAGIAGSTGSTGDGGPATAAKLNMSGGSGIIVDNAGNVYIANTALHNVRKINTSGIITRIAGSATGSSGGAGDGGPATNAQLNFPLGMCLDTLGNLYIADQGNNKIRMITPAGIITTFAGNGSNSYSGDGGPATNARMNQPRDCKFDVFGNLYITDAVNNVVRKVDPSGIMTTFAGVHYSGTATYSGDGGPATAAYLTTPARLTYDGGSLVYVSDQSNNRIREINLVTNKIRSVAGNGTAGYSGDGSAATACQIWAPAGIATDLFGNFFMSDANNRRVRVVQSMGSIAITVTSSGGTHICSGTTLNFNAHTSIAGNITYHWQKNGSDISVGTTPSFSTSTATNNDSFRCIAYVTPGCGSTFTDTSNTIVMTVDNVAKTVTSTLGSMFAIAIGQSMTLHDSTAGGTWSSGAPLVGTINATTGVVTGISGGTLPITYTVSNACGTTNAYSTGTVTALPAVMAWANTGGTISPSGWWVSTLLPGGTTNTYTITPGTGYRVWGVVVDSFSYMGGIFSYTFSSIISNHTIHAVFMKVDTINASAGTNGSISPSGTITVDEGSSQTYTFTPATGYHVNNVVVDGTSVGAVSSYTFSSISGNHSISVSFAINTYDIVASSGSNGSVSPSGTTTLNYGNSQTYTISPAAGYHIASVTVDGSSVGTGGSYTFSTVSANHAISATFAINTFNIVASACSNGSISPSGTSTVNYGDNQTCTISPAAGYHTADVNVDGSSAGTSGAYTFSSVAANHTISASFAINSYTVTASAGANGTVSPAGATINNYGDNQTIIITPATGYSVSDVLVDGSSVGAVTTYTFSSISANHTLSATFVINNYILTSSAGANGSISPSGSTSKSYGSSQTYTITPATGYHVADVLVDGSSVGAVTSYTFSSISAAHDISASFAINSYTITATAGPNGSISPAGASVVTYGGTQSYTISPSGTYVIQSVSIDGVNVGAVSTYTFTSVSADHTVDVLFAAPPAPAGISPSSDTMCVASTHSYSFAAVGGSWASSNSSVANIVSTSSSGSAIAIVQGVSAGTATLTYTLLGVDYLATITVNPLPAAGTISGPTDLCVFNSITLSASVSGGVWSAKNTIDSVGSTSGIVVAKAWGRDTIIYTVSTPSCGSASASVSVASSGSVGTIYTCAGTGANATGPENATAFDNPVAGPRDMVADTAGNIYFCDATACVVRKISKNGFIQTVAGTVGVSGTTGDGGPALSAKLNMGGGGGIYVDKDGTMYIACTGSHSIRKVSPTGTITLYAGTPGSAGSTGDGGSALSAKLNFPLGMAVDTLGNLYIADQSNHKIRKVTPSGTISTFIGTGSNSPVLDGAPLSSTLNQPRDVKFDINGNLYITDAANNRIRVYKPSTGLVSTLAGNGTASFSGDGGPADLATLNTPARLSYDGASLIYFSDQNDNVIRQINLASGVINSVAGNATAGFSGDGGPAKLAQIWAPAGIASDNAGNFYISDANNRRIRVISSQGSLAITITGPGTGHVCSTAADTFVAHSSITGSATYQWYKNNTPIAGATNVSYITSSSVTGDQYQAIVTVYPACPAGSSFNDTSNLITITVDRIASAVAITGTNSLCPGTSVTLLDSATGGTWLSSNPSVASIGSATGVLSGLVAGNTTITYSVTNACGSSSATYPVTVNALSTISSYAGSNGAISPTPTVNVCPGSNQSFSITPNTGYVVNTLTVDGATVAPATSYTFTAVSAGTHSISATFIAVDTIIATAGSNGSISPAGTTTLLAGGSQSYTFSPNTGYVVSNVLVDGVSLGALSSYTFSSVSSNHSISVSFAVGTHPITATAGANGTISPSGVTNVTNGGSQIYSMTPATGYHIADVTVDGASVGAVSGYTFSSVSASHTISVSFAINTYNIVAAAGTNGTVSPSGTTVANYGDNDIYTITPAAGYHVTDVTVDGASLGALSSYTFSAISADHSISATFAINTYTIVATTGTHGTVSPAGTTVANYGDNDTYTMTPSAGYHVNNVVVDGSSVGAVSSYTFSSISASHTISASFTVNTFTLFNSSGTGGSVDPSGITSFGIGGFPIVFFGGSQSFTITPATGYHVLDVLIDGSSIGAVTSYTFTGVIADHTISATFAINTYNIVASSGSNGTVSPSGTTVANYGDNDTYTITPATGYHVADVTVDGASVGAVSSYIFSAISAGHTISASFAINTYDLVATSGTNGSVSPSGTTVANYGDNDTYTIAPATGYHIADVTVDGASAGAVSSYTFSAISANHSISASFAINTYNIVATSGTNGTISPAGTTVANYGDNDTYTFAPATGYHVADVTVDGSSVGAVSSYTFSAISANHTISASFAINTYNIDATTGANGMVSPTGTSVANYGDNDTYTITPATGYHIADVTVDGSSAGAVSSYTFSAISANHTISASFAINTYNIVAASGANGTVSPAGTTVVNYGDDAIYAITPATGYHIVDVTVDGASAGAVSSYTFSSISTNHTISASFAINNYGIVATSGPNGSISPAGLTSVTYGGSQSYSMVAATGYHIADVTVDGVSAGAVSSYSFTSVAAGHTISVLFAINTFNIVATAGANGSVSPSGTTAVSYGANQTYAIVPSTGYHISDVTVDGTSMGAIGSYTFSSVSADHTISATFAINNYSIIASSGPNGSVSPSGTTTLTYGSSQTYSIIPAPGYHVMDVTVDGASVSAVGAYTFSSISADHTISASFAVNNYVIVATSGANGTISPVGPTSVTSGGSQSYSMTPFPGYHVVDVAVDGVSIGAVTSYTFSSVTANHSITVLYSINSYNIVATSGANGSISPAGTTTLTYGGIQVYSIVPATGYHIADITVDGVSAGAVGAYTFTGVSADHTISASFAINTFNIVATSGANGTVSPAGTTVANYGDNDTYSITPATGYHVADVTVDGASVGAVTSYVFSSISASHTISASFAINTYNIVATSGANGTVTPSGTSTVSYGGSQAYAIVPATGYHVVDVTVDGVSAGAVGTYTFSSVSAGHTISASFAINTYNIVATSGTNGSVSPAGTTTVSYGGNQTYTIAAATGYHVAGVTVDGASVGAVSSYTFSSVTANHTISASFAINTYTIVSSTNPSGTISPLGTTTLSYGATQVYTMTPNTGKYVFNVTVDGVSVGAVTSYTFTSVSANHTISVSFETIHNNIVASTGANGTISPVGTTSVIYGSSQSYTMTPDAGYHVANVLVDGISMGAISSYTFSSVIAAHTISVSYAINNYSIVATSGANGSVSPSGTTTLSYGATQNYTITPATGYHINNVTVDGVSVGATGSYTFSSVSASHTISASFEINTYYITATAGSDGSISPSGTSAATYGSSQTYTITPATGYHITDVTVDGISAGTAGTYTFSSISSDHSIVASFAINTYDIVATSGANGYISPGGTSTLNYGDFAMYNMTPATGYHIDNVVVDGASAGAVSSYIFSSVSASHTISVSFAINTYSVVATAGANGTISPAGTTMVSYSGSQTYTITPATGYHITGVTVDGASIGAVGTYTFSSVTANHTISASFAINTYNIVAATGANGSISPAGTTTVNYGNNQTYSMTAASGYHVANVVVDGSSVGAVTSYTFSSVSAGHTISVSFAINTYNIVASAGANGTVTPGGTSVVSFGSTQSYAITPATGYHVDNVTVDGVSIGAVSSYTFSSVSAGHTISATFAINNYNLVASAGANGTISPAGTTVVSYGGSQVYTITPASGYHIADVTVDGSSAGTSGTYTFSSVSAGHVISASFAINTYNVVATSGANGTVSPAGTSVVSSGGSQAYTITPATGYHISAVTVDGASVGAVTSYTFSAVTASHTISASFAINTYSLTASAGTNGTISPAGTTTVSYGGSQVYTITPSTGYHIVAVTVDGASAGAVGTYTFSSVSASHTISASFAINTYTITATAGSNGSISPSGATTVSYGGSQAYTITAATGYHIADVTVDGASAGTGGTYTFSSVSASHAISASFAVNCTAPTVSSTVTPTSTIYTGGDSHKLYLGYGAPSSVFSVTATGGTGITYSWSPGTYLSSSTASNPVFTPTSAGSFTYTCTVTNSGGCASTITIAMCAIDAIDHGYTGTGHKVLVCHVPPGNPSNAHVISVDTSSVPAHLTLHGGDHLGQTCDNPCGVVATTYMIVASSVSNGTISPVDTTVLWGGSSQSYTITPATGYHVSSVTVDGASVGAVTSYTFSAVSANHTISASFAINSYSLIATAGSNGTISPAGTTTVSYGATQVYSFTPSAGYSVASVTVDGTSAGAATSYTFSSISANHTISVTFAISGVHVTASAGANGSVSPSGTTPVSYGGSQVYTITPSAGYHVSAVTVDGTLVGAVSNYTFSSVTVNHTISATFAINTYTVTSSAGTHGTISPNGATVVNYGANQSYTITPNTGYVVSAVTVDGASVGAVSSYTFTSVASNHTISATFGPNCSGFTVSGSVTNVSCYGGNTGSVTATASGGVTAYTYLWNTGATTAALTSRPAGSYTVTATDSRGCTATGSYAVTQPSAALAISATVTNVSCHGGNNGSINTTVTGGTASYTYSWSNGSTAADPGTLSASSYTVTVTDAHSCTLVHTYSVTQPSASLTCSHSCSTDYPVSGGSWRTIYQNYGPQHVTCTATASGGTSGYSYSYSPSTSCSAPTSHITDCSPTSDVVYTVTVTDSHGCVAHDTCTVKYTATDCSPDGDTHHHHRHHGCSHSGYDSDDDDDVYTKVCMCHSGHLISVDSGNVLAHLAVGDHLGPCDSDPCDYCEDWDYGWGSGYGWGGGSCGGGWWRKSDTSGHTQVVATGAGNIRVYPNPASGIFNVEVPADHKEADVVITDIAGREVQRRHISDNSGAATEFNLNMSPRGVYLLNITAGNIVYKLKLVLN